MKTEVIILLLMEASDQVRVFHWQTLGYAEHKALGGLYDALSDATDKIAETLIGVDGKRPALATSIVIQDYRKSAPESYLKALAKQLSDWKDLPTDVLNMRDDLLGKVHHTLYLLTLK